MMEAGAPFQVALVGTLKAMKKGLDRQKMVISDCFERAQEQKEERDQRRKKLMINEVKAVLKRLHEEDTELLKELKNEAWDKCKSIEKIERELVNLAERVESCEEEDEEVMKRAVKVAEEEIIDLDIEQFQRLPLVSLFPTLMLSSPISRLFELNVSVSGASLSPAFQKVCLHVSGSIFNCLKGGILSLSCFTCPGPPNLEVSCHRPRRRLQVSRGEGGGGRRTAICHRVPPKEDGSEGGDCQGGGARGGNAL